MFLMSANPVVFGMWCERRVVRVERQRDVGHEAVRLVLQLAQPHQVIDAVFVVLDVAVEHRAVRAQPQLVRDARGLDPLVAVDLVVADDAADALVEDLRAAAGQRIHAGVAQAFQRLANRDFGAPRQVRDLHHRERLQVHLREALLQPAEHLAEPVERQLGMQAADDVEFGDRFAPALAGAMPDLFERHRVRLGIAHPLAEGAQPATRHANVGRIDVAVDVEIRGVAVQPLADDVGQVAERQDIAGAVERQAVLEREPLARLAPCREWEGDGDRRLRFACFRHPV